MPIVPPVVGASVSAGSGTAKDSILHIKHRRRHVIDLPHHFGILEHPVDSLLARWNDISDDINRQSASRQINDSYTAAYNELCCIMEYYQENIVNRCKKLVGLGSGADGEAGNQTLVNELSAASEYWKNRVYASTFYELARLDKDVVNFTTEVTAVENRITLDVPSHQELLSELQQCLYEAGFKRIAIYGSPQVGKTNILRNLNNWLVRCPPGLEFKHVIWVTFPTHLPKPEDIISNIQDIIFRRLNLFGQNSGSGKTEVISRALCEKSYLLLFGSMGKSSLKPEIHIS